MDLDLYRRVVGRFTTLVEAVRPDQWDAATPDEGWDVADLVAHVVDRDRMVASTVGDRVPDELDGVGRPQDLPDAWRSRVRWWEDRLADPATAGRSWQTPFGTRTLAEVAVESTVAELTVHSWDLARAIGDDERLDAEAVAASLRQLHEREATLRRPGVMAPAVPVPDDADDQTRLLAFTGRRP